MGFDNEESARKAAETPFHSINGKTVLFVMFVSTSSDAVVLVDGLFQ